jgi:O-antigen/teichoic acid export membrane protein
LKIAYLLAVISNRIISLVALLVLSHILEARAFGSYALMITNALLIHTLVGSWLAMATTRLLAAHGLKGSQAQKRQIVIAAGYVIIFECLIAFLIAGVHAATGWDVGYAELLAILSLAIGMLLFDIITAANNAVGDDTDYLRFNMARNVATSLICITAAIAGASIPLVILGHTMGIIIAFATTPRAMRSWREAVTGARRAALQKGQLSDLLIFGVTGTLALGLFVLVNGLIRNFVLATDGAAIAGIYSLISDLFYAPMVLLGTAYSLSKMRELYQSVSAQKAEQLVLHRQFVATICFLIIPYSVGGFLVAPAIAALITPDASAAFAHSIAGQSAAQSGALTMVATCVTILLTSGQKRRTVAVVTATVLCMFIACVAGWALGGELHYASTTLVGSIAACVIAILALGFDAIPWKNLFRIALASAPMWIVVTLLLRSESIAYLVLAVIGGLFTYAAFSLLLGNKEWQELVPARLEKNVG